MSDPVREVVRAVVVVSGKVQGVFFRGSAQAEGMRLGLLGEVRNLPDRSVEAIVEGERHAVEEFIAWCRKGPGMAQVEAVEISWSSPRGEFRTFVVAR
jgi:acylphosphatase